MRVALFVPCYIDQLDPEVGVATLRLLRGLDLEVIYPSGQTCCGQPASNCGASAALLPTVRHFVDVFDGFDHIVCPSGSCVAMVRRQYPRLSADPRVAKVASRCIELCEFLTDVVKVERMEARLDRRVALLNSCHGLRELGLGVPSECAAPGQGPGQGQPQGPPPPSKPERLLTMVEGLSLVRPQRPDECCGFGGTFAVTHGALSAHMGHARLDALRDSGAELLVGTDASCLLHLSALAQHAGRPLPTAHIAQVLAGMA